jgi:MSHA biogenesis protein MshK
LDEAVKILNATILAALALTAHTASAQALLDPTRPPASLGARLDAAAGDGLPRLQSVLISPRQGGRHIAVIDGETVRLGDNYKGARVARMTQTEVELVRGRERQVLRLEPAPLPPIAGAGIQAAN